MPWCTHRVRAASEVAWLKLPASACMQACIDKQGGVLGLAVPQPQAPVPRQNIQNPRPASPFSRTGLLALGSSAATLGQQQPGS